MDSTSYRRVEYNSQTDTKLWIALCSGETGALGQIYDRHAGQVYGISLKLLGNAQEAEDLTQDIFVNLAESKKYDPARGSLRTFLMMLTRSRAIDRLRSRQSTQRSKQKLQAGYSASVQATADLTAENILENEQSETVKAALAQLSEVQRQALHLAYYEGLTQADIASHLKTPLGTVKARTRRGLLKLREILSAHQDGHTQPGHAQGGRE